MKFLCPSCKTKYQIADDKVSGRAVRMKCRKCGFVIPISEVPPAPPTMAPPPGGDRLPPVPKAPLPPRGLEPPPSRPASKPAAVPVTKPLAAPSPKPIGTPAPRPVGTPAPRVVRPGASAVLGTSKGIGPAPATPIGNAVEGARRQGAHDSEPSSAFDDADEQPTAIVSGGALAAAFGAFVTAPSAKPVDSVMPADEWYVGINDVSVGPIRLAELRAKAVSGAVQADSLVWRDGLEDWRPLKSFPELLAVLEESLSSVRASAVPFTAPAARPNHGFGTPLPSGVTSVGVMTDDLAAAGLARTRTPLAAWFAIAAALACGVAIGAFFFVKQKPPEVITKYVDRPVPGAEQPAAVGAQPPAVDTPAGADSATAKTRTGSRTNVKPVAATDADKGGGLPGLKGLDGLRPTGPGPGSTPGTTSPGGGGSQLDQSQIQSTVSRYTGSVKRSCWQPALDSRDPSAPTSARVVVTITVAPSGNVQNVTTSGEPRGYPGLASCIAGRVRAWQFPPSSGTTTANVPFVFAAQ
ncbi:MAG TPA: GYF domain-containing protein [Polyangiaceae bacterium]